MSEFEWYQEYCEAVCWMDERGRGAECWLPKGHSGPHSDPMEGWEW